jgi:hypothetical protein
MIPATGLHGLMPDSEGPLGTVYLAYLLMDGVIEGDTNIHQNSQNSLGTFHVWPWK